jgi:phosphoglycolate phosphatase
VKTIIFDFDGTLVDSLPVVVEIAEEVGGVRLAPEEIAKMRNMSARDVLKYSGISYYKLPGLLLRGKQLLGKRLNELKIFTGMSEVVKALHQADYTVCVLSSNSEGNIRKVLKNAGIEEYFDNVYGNVGLFTKAVAIKKVIKRQHATASTSVYIGDEVRDIEASKKSGVPIISVTWGYNGEQILRTYQPDYLATSPKDISKILL